jgi:hypothetical protein
MAECVSCGKDIPAGKLFCDDCYKKMKGRKGSLKKVAQPAGVKPLDTADKPLPSMTSEDAGQAVENGAIAPAGMPEGLKKASGSLTPSSGKKVVSIKPDLEKTARDKGIGGKKKFTITISFSDRTYAALARFKGKKKEEIPTIPNMPGELITAGEPGEVASPIRKAKYRGRKAGPHGRAMLKAVGGETASGGRTQGFYRRTMGYRDRKWDTGDKVAAIMATASMILVIIMIFLGWVRFTWFEGENNAATTVNIKGIDLGLIVYIMVVMTVLAWLFMVLTRLLKKPLVNLDFGVVMLATGILLIIITFIALSSSGLTIKAAGNILKIEDSLQNTITGYEKQNLWPAYMMILAFCLMAFSGLIRLSERKT